MYALSMLNPGVSVSPRENARVTRNHPAGGRGLTAYVLASAICRLKMSGGLIETRPRRTYSRACTGRGQGAVGKEEGGGEREERPRCRYV